MSPMETGNHHLSALSGRVMVPSNGVMFTVFTRKDHMNAPSSRIHDVGRPIYQKAQSSQVEMCLLTFSEMAEPVLVFTGPKVSVDKWLI